MATNGSGPSNAGASNILFSMDGNVLSLDNLTAPVRTEALPPPPPLTIEAELALLRREVLAMKHARNQPTTSRSGGRTRTRRPQPSARASDGGRAPVFSRLGQIVEVDRRGGALVIPTDTVRSHRQRRRSGQSQWTDHVEDSATASSARTPDVRRDTRELERQYNKGKGPANSQQAHRDQSDQNQAREERGDGHNHNRSVDLGGNERQRRSMDGRGAQNGALTVRGEGSRGNRGADPIEVSAGPEYDEDNGLRPGDRYTIRNDGGSIVLVNAQTGQTKVYHAEPDARRHRPRPEAAEGRSGRNKRLSSDQWHRTAGPAKRTHEEHRTVDLNRSTPADSRLEKAKRSPFSRAIVEAAPPRGFKIPKFDKYEPTTDAITHVQQYRLVSELYGHSDSLMCRTFSMSLGTAALLWYGQLAPGSINDFDELKRAFTSQFVTSNTQPKTLDALVNMKRGSDETLKEYIARY